MSRIRAAHPALRSLVRREHVGFEDFTGARWIEPPCPDVVLMVTLSGSLTEDGTRLPDAWLAGPSVRSSVVEMSEAYACVEVRLRPLGAYTLLARPLEEVSARVAALDDLLGASARQMSERVLEARDWETRFAAIDDFLVTRLDRGPAPSSAIGWALTRLETTEGCVSIGDLASELRWSRRHLVAKFREQVGLPPKTVARLLRFEGVLRRIDADAARWADIAQDCGYCDQSHLNRDFRDLLGTTPTEYVARRRGAGGVEVADVTFLQDAAPARV